MSLGTVRGIRARPARTGIDLVTIGYGVRFLPIPRTHGVRPKKPNYLERKVTSPPRTHGDRPEFLTAPAGYWWITPHARGSS